MTRKEALVEAQRRWDSFGERITAYTKLRPKSAEFRYEVGSHKKGKSPVVRGLGNSWESAFAASDLGTLETKIENVDPPALVDAPSADAPSADSQIDIDA